MQPRLLFYLATTLLVAVVLVSPAAPRAQPADAAPGGQQIDGQKLFATSCGWCHSNGGRMAGKGPKLAGTQRDDAFIVNRIKHGKEGAMPAFGGAFSDAQIAGIVRYIRSLPAN